MTTISEIKTIDVQDVCTENYIFLKWKNSLGGFDNWCFELPQSNTAEIEESVSYSQPTIDFNENLKQLHKKSIDKITCYAFEDFENSEGFKDMFKSDFVQMYVDYTDETGATLYKWVDVLLSLKSWENSTNKSKLKFSFEVNLRNE